MGKWSRGVGAFLGAVLATTAYGQAPLPKDSNVYREIIPSKSKPPADTGVHRMVILNGLNREVRHFETSPLSPGDSAALRDLDRAENMAHYADSLQTLKQRYVNSDLQLEPERRYVQKALYGNNITMSGSSYLNYFSVATNTNGLGYPYNLPYNYGFGGYGMGYGMGGYGMGGNRGGTSSSFNRSLANGVGDEGRLKTAMAPVIAKDAASPEFMTTAYRDYDNAVARAASSAKLRAALSLPKTGTGVPVEYDRPRYPVSLTLKNGTEVHGETMKEDGDFYVVESKYATERVRKSEVTRVIRAKAGVKPIGD